MQSLTISCWGKGIWRGKIVAIHFISIVQTGGEACCRLGGGGIRSTWQRSCAAEFDCDSTSEGDAIRLRGIKQMKIGPLRSAQAAPRPRRGAAPRATRGRWLDLRGK